VSKVAQLLPFAPIAVITCLSVASTPFSRILISPFASPIKFIKGVWKSTCFHLFVDVPISSGGTLSVKFVLILPPAIPPSSTPIFDWGSFFSLFITMC
jgi:hypothetical protein